MNEASDRDPFNNNSFGTLVDSGYKLVNLPVLDVVDFNERVIRGYEEGWGERDLPADLGLARSLVPAGTATLRDFSNISPEIPDYISENCTGCMDCVTECPDTAILGKVLSEEEWQAKLAALPAEDRDMYAKQWSRTKKYYDAGKKKTGYPIVILDGALEKALGVPHFPFNGVIDPDGKIAYAGDSPESTIKKLMKGARPGSMWPKALQGAAQLLRDGKVGEAWAELQSGKNGLSDREKAVHERFTGYVSDLSASTVKRAADLLKADRAYAALKVAEAIANAKPELPGTADAIKLVGEIKALPSFDPPISPTVAVAQVDHVFTRGAPSRWITLPRRPATAGDQRRRSPRTCGEMPNSDISRAQPHGPSTHRCTSKPCRTCSGASSQSCLARLLSESSSMTWRTRIAACHGPYRPTTSIAPPTLFGRGDPGLCAGLGWRTRPLQSGRGAPCSTTPAGMTHYFCRRNPSRRLSPPG